jgi:hypothetical protein
MQLTNLSNNTLATDISIYCRELTDSIFKDFRFVDLINNLIKKDSICKYKFAIYTDLSIISANIFIPVFHTMYLGSSNHNVLISDSNDLWLIDTFTNNKYFIIPKENDDFNYKPYNITKITNIKEIK